MCFSAAASFVSGGAIGVAGGVCVSKVQKKREYPLALVPVFFAMQQLMEGFVWLSISENVSMWAAYGFLFFAFIVWPTWVPLTVYLLEKEEWRRKRMLPMLIVGGLVSAILLMGLFIYDLQVGLFDYHVLYSANVGEIAWLANLLTVIYVVIVCGTPMLSSKRFFRNSGIAILVAYLAAAYFYNVVFVSVWCFFAAVLSIGVLAYFLRLGSKK